jgi:hypothetical protein
MGYNLKLPIPVGTENDGFSAALESGIGRANDLFTLRMTNSYIF